MMKCQINNRNFNINEPMWSYLENILKPHQDALTTIPIIVDDIVVGYTTKNLMEAIVKDLLLLQR